MDKASTHQPINKRSHMAYGLIYILLFVHVNTLYKAAAATSTLNHSKDTNTFTATNRTIYDVVHQPKTNNNFIIVKNTNNTYTAYNSTNINAPVLKNAKPPNGVDFPLFNFKADQLALWPPDTSNIGDVLKKHKDTNYPKKVVTATCLINTHLAVVWDGQSIYIKNTGKNENPDRPKNAEKDNKVISIIPWGENHIGQPTLLVCKMKGDIIAYHLPKGTNGLNHSDIRKVNPDDPENKNQLPGKDEEYILTAIQNSQITNDLLFFTNTHVHKLENAIEIKESYKYPDEIEGKIKDNTAMRVYPATAKDHYHIFLYQSDTCFQFFCKLQDNNVTLLKVGRDIGTPVTHSITLRDWIEGHKLLTAGVFCLVVIVVITKVIFSASHSEPVSMASTIAAADNNHTTISPSKKSSKSTKTSSNPTKDIPWTWICVLLLFIALFIIGIRKYS